VLTTVAHAPLPLIGDAMASSGAPLHFRGIGALPIRLEEHCTECGAPSCYQTCSLFEPAEGAGCRRFVSGIQLSRTDTWTGLSADLVFKPWAMLKAKLTRAQASDTWLHGFLLQLELSDAPAESDQAFAAILDFTASPWSPELPQVRIPLLMRHGVTEAYVPPADLQHLAGAAAVQVSLSFPLERPQLVRLHASHFVEAVVNAHSQRIAPTKLLAIDLDGTLWTGSVDEADVPPTLRSGTADALRRMQARRLDIAVISAASRHEAMAHLDRLGLSSIFSAVECDVMSKADKLAEIAQAASLAPEEVIFVDDDEFTRHLVTKAMPGVWVCSEKILSDLWTNPCVTGGFGGVQVTERRGPPVESYFASTLDYRAPRSDELQRCFELLQRANRLHCVEWRPTLGELARALDAGGVTARVGLCRDETGAFGLVCFALFEQDDDGARLRSLVFSCRVINRSYPWYFCAALHAELAAGKAVPSALRGPAPRAASIATDLVAVALGHECFAGSKEDPVTVHSWSLA